MAWSTTPNAIPTTVGSAGHATKHTKIDEQLAEIKNHIEVLEDAPAGGGGDSLPAVPEEVFGNEYLGLDPEGVPYWGVFGGDAVEGVPDYSTAEEGAVLTLVFETVETPGGPFTNKTLQWVVPA
jgi:hypothetical protein